MPTVPSGDELTRAEALFDAYMSVDPQLPEATSEQTWGDLTDDQKAAWVRILRYLDAATAGTSSDPALIGRFTMINGAGNSGSRVYHIEELRGPDDAWHAAHGEVHYSGVDNAGGRFGSLRFVATEDDSPGDDSLYVGEVTSGEYYTLGEIAASDSDLGSAGYVKYSAAGFEFEGSVYYYVSWEHHRTSPTPASSSGRGYFTQVGTLTGYRVDLGLRLDWVTGVSGQFQMDTAAIARRTPIELSHSAGERRRQG